MLIHAAGALILMTSAALAQEPGTSVDVAPFAGELLLAAAVLLGAPIAAFVVRWLAALGSRIGFQVEEDRRYRLQEIVEHGLREAAMRLGVMLDGKLTFEVKNALVAETARYVVKHGSDTLKKLQGDPDNLAAVEEIVRGRGGTLLDQAEVSAPLRTFRG